jgi:hypothetical protein
LNDAWINEIDECERAVTPKQEMSTNGQTDIVRGGKGDRHITPLIECNERRAFD